MDIREATTADISRLCRIIADFRIEHGEKITAQENELLPRIIAMAIQSGNSRLFLAIEDGDIIGYSNVHIIPFPLLRGVEWYISDLLVVPDFRGRGVGSSLLDHIEQRALKSEVKRLMLNNSRKSVAYKSGFYSKRGYNEREQFGNFTRKFVVE